jgi:hypothetical protein
MAGKKRITLSGRIVRSILWLILIFIISTGIYIAFVRTGRKPDIKDISALNIKREKYGDNTYITGKNWLRKSESGIWECYLEGDAFERGAAFGILTRELLFYQESVFLRQIKELIPSEFYLKVLRHFISFFNRDLEKNIIEEYRDEIYGTSFASDTSFDYIGTGYERQLNYHAAHDIAHALNDFSLVGCTSFSVWGSKSSDSSVITGRNFDFYAGDKFAENKIVCFINPDKGYKFMMVTWADMIGVVSGMNEKGLTVTLNAAKSAIPVRSSTPVTILAREILQYASTIEEAFEISKKRNLFVSESIMISSAADGKTAIIEKSPRKYDLFYSGTDQIICSNHFQGESFKDDERNLTNISESDSKPRYLRTQELLDERSTVDVNYTAAILRNREGLGNKNIGLGNQLALNQLIAHHSVIFKPGSLIAWVSESPYQIGRYIAYDLEKVFSTDIATIRDNQEIYSSELIIPADSFLYSREYGNFVKYKKMTSELNEMRAVGNTLPDHFVEEYLSSNPNFYLTYVHMGDYYRKLKENSLALDYYDYALTLSIPQTYEKERIERLALKMK